MTSERAVPGTDVLTAGTFAAMLAPEEWSRLAELGHSVRFPAGAVLMAERSESDLVMILLEGHVKATIIGDGGREALLSLRDPGDVLGELSAIDGQPRIATVTALDRIRALAVPAPVFRRHLELTPRVAVALLVVVTHRVREATLLRSQFGGSDTMARLAARLVELAERYGRRTDNGVLITLALSQEELGAWTGASRAALANALRTLRELGWIATDRRRVLVLDLPSLRDRAA